MEVASSAFGITSLNIQVCQDLLSYHNSWKGYNADITTVYGCMEDISETLKLLEGTLGWQNLGPLRLERNPALNDCYYCAFPPNNVDRRTARA